MIGLARGAQGNGNKLAPLKSRLEELANRSDLHVVNKLHLARCLSHIEGDEPLSPSLEKLWRGLRTPAQGFIERDGWPEHRDRSRDFSFDYEFEKHKVSELGRLFGISENEAADAIAEEVIKRWPGSTSMSDFSGRVHYGRGDRFESYREHIQRHAQLHAATTLATIRPVVLSHYDREERNPWREFLLRNDVSFEDGSWLSDHKDRVPVQAREYLLGKRDGGQETLDSKEVLLRKIGYPEEAADQFMPLHGHWKSPDGVRVSISSALVNHRGAIGQCAKEAKAPDHQLWLPRFEADGCIDRFAGKSPYDPLIWEPEEYPIGVDEGDEWAARGARARPKLGRAFIRMLQLTPNQDEREWTDPTGRLALKSEVWGQWRPERNVHQSVYQDEGEILWATRDWLDDALSECKRGLIFKIEFWKYKSSSSYDDSPGVRELYLGVQRSGELPRFWFAKKASKTVY